MSYIQTEGAFVRGYVGNQAHANPVEGSHKLPGWIKIKAANLIIYNQS